MKIFKLAVLILIGLLCSCQMFSYVVLTPILPAINFRLFQPQIAWKQSDSVFKTAVDSESSSNTNRLVIPKIAVNAEILESENVEILRQAEGVWRDPLGSVPSDGGNTIIAGHRFQYLPPNTVTFYRLPELDVGDKLQIYWQNAVYNYEIYQRVEVYPDDVGMLSNSVADEQELTIYTCTPLFTAQKRLVLKAKILIG